MARNKSNPYEDGDDAKFVSVHKRHRIRGGVGSSGRTAKFVRRKMHKKRIIKK